MFVRSDSFREYFLVISYCIILRKPCQQAGRKKNWSIDSFSCSPPRKSLVKGERIMRDEGKPELTKWGNTDDLLNTTGEFMWDKTLPFLWDFFGSFSALAH